mmetsp:Transcript_30043/g.84639  ORF Transcript_30043/g.84639 Transcript_30043/m.84639 type:complete len:1295 (+) Transcript_30043:66-3950(+)
MGAKSRDGSRSRSGGRKGTKDPGRSRSGKKPAERSHSRDRGNRGGRSKDRSRRRSRDKHRRSRSRSKDRCPSPTYSIEDLWRRLDHLSKWRDLGKKEKTRAKLAGAEKDDLRAFERKMDKRLESGYRTSCIRTALSILEQGFEVKKEQLERMLAQSVQRPGVVQVAMTLRLVSMSASASVGIEPFLRGLGVLVQRNAPVQLVRLWLNLGLPKAARALRDLPHDYDEEERNLAAQDLEDALGVITDDEEDERGATRSVIYVTGCKARPELNGRFERAEDMTAHGRPVYEKVVERKISRDKGKGKGKKGGGISELKQLLMAQMGEDQDEIKQEVYVLHYRRDPNGVRNGWWFSRNNCGGEDLGWNARETKGPPTGGWFIVRDRAKLPDPIRIVDPSKVGELSGNSRRNEAQQAIAKIDGQRLKGRLVTHDNSVAAAEYFGHFCMLMHLEHMEELRQIKRRTQRLPEMELQRLGWCLDGLPCTGVFGRREPKKVTIIGWEDPGSEMGALALPPSTTFERLKFKRGDSVTISESRQQVRKGEQLEKIGDGFVADLRPARGREEAQVVIRLRGCWPDDAMSRRWRIDKGANSTLYERQLQAMLNLVTNARPRVSELLITAKVGLADSWAQQWRKGGVVTDEDKRAAAAAAERAMASAEEGGKRENPAAKLARLNPGGAESDKLDRALKEVKTLTHLNQSQRDSIRSALSHTCTVIQGPPGTGKTHVSVQIMRLWSKTLDLSPLLATSDSNVAVDNIAMGLRKEGVKAVRVGRPDKINRILEEITLECLLDKEKVELEDRKYQSRYRSKSRSKSPSPFKRRQKSKSKSPQKEDDGDEGRGGKGKGKKGKGKGGMKADFELQMRILQDADAICTTTISSGGDFFSKFQFAGILVDEAAQATELAAVVPLILRGTQRLVLVGDQCQLPPTVQSTEAEERGLSLSLYSRMVDGGGIVPFLLDTQYRSHPLIAEFSARTFYANRLKSGVKAEDRRPPRGLPWPRDGCPLAFVDVHSEEASEGESKLNQGEADVICRLVQDVFYQRELEVTEVGVVTPYVAQVRILKRMLRGVVPENADPELLEVASVDNFQGREKDLIVFSAVRSNRSGTVGFLADWRRLNVMLTRARRGLVVVGNSRTLKSDEHWSKWLDFYARCGSGRARTPSPEKRGAQKVDPNETEEELQKRLKKERVDAARRLSMAIRFPGLAMAQNDRNRSRSPSAGGLMGEADTLSKAKGGRKGTRAKTPSPVRAAKVVSVGIGRRNKGSEFAAAPSAPKAKAKAAAARAKNKVAIASDGEDSESAA